MKPWGALRRTVAPSISPDRLLLALKTAIAAGLAWPVAHSLPGTVDEYSYYAPLGALISMMPTLMGSLRASMQTALGLALGVGLAWLVVLSPVHGVVTVPIAVGIGVLVAGFRGLGVGRDYVPIAALFVLIVGGTKAEDYSMGYLVQMAIGMAIGVIVNLVVVPPLRLKDAGRQVEALRMRVADSLGDMARIMAEPWPPESQDWFDNAQTLEADINTAAQVVEDAGESSRMNPRARRHPYDLQRDHDDLAAITLLSRDINDLCETIGGAIWGEPVPAELPKKLRRPLGEALSAAADSTRAWNSGEGEDEALDAADAAVQQLHDLQHELPLGESPDGASGAITFSLRRLIATVRSRVDRH